MRQVSQEQSYSCGRSNSMERYILSVDQSTQGTKAMLIDAKGRLASRYDTPHTQYVDANGWVSHDPDEIYQNLLESVRGVIQKAGIAPEQIVCIGISNQRETSAAWDRQTGKPICKAIVWQCARARSISARVVESDASDMVRQRTGIPISPFFPAAKLAWIMENIPQARTLQQEHRLCMGTIDTWLLFRLTNGRCYKTDLSNASRTQLLNLRTLRWDPEICRLFGLSPDDLPEICASDEWFGETTVDDILPKPVPVCAVLGDSHAALFGQGCLEKGMAKATYGTGSSIMINIGDAPVLSNHGLVTSVAWSYNGITEYVMEGNLNYTGAVITWLQKNLGLIVSAAETQKLAQEANAGDQTYFIPAFTGLGAPYWRDDIQAMFCGITRLTGRAELVKAGLECIAYQITDIVHAIEKDVGMRLRELRVDGGPTRNQYLMQFQSDLLSASLLVPDSEELSGIGAAYMAGLRFGLFGSEVFSSFQRTVYTPKMSPELSAQKYSGWLHAVAMLLHG